MLLCPFCLCLIKKIIFCLIFLSLAPKLFHHRPWWNEVQIMFADCREWVIWVTQSLSKVLAKVLLMGICKSVTQLADKVHSVLCFSIASKDSLSKLKAICGQISTPYLLWWVKHHSADLTYFQLCLLSNNAFFFFSFSHVSLYLSLQQVISTAVLFCFQNIFLVFFFPWNYYLALCVPERKQIVDLFVIRSKCNLYECVQCLKSSEI